MEKAAFPFFAAVSLMQSQLAKHMGVTPEYVSMILNGHREPQHAQERFRAALDELIASKA